MRDELEAEGIRLRDHRIGDHKVTCPKCSHERKNKRDPCLSVTVESEESAVWKCHHCEWTGQVGKPDRKDWRRERPGTKSVRQKPEPPPQPPAKIDGGELSKRTLAFFAMRGISEETVRHFGILEVRKKMANEVRNAVAIPYRFDGETVNHKYRAIDEKLFSQDRGTRRTLFNIDSVDAHWSALGEDEPKTVIFCEGEMDVMTLHEAGYPNAVSLPDGAAETIDINDKRFDALRNCAWVENADRVILAGDMDGPGMALRNELIRRFGSAICWTVKWPGVDGCTDVRCKDANETLMNNDPETVAACIRNSEPMPIEGLFGISDYRAAVLDLYHGNYERPVSTGYEDLDEIYRVMPGTFNVVTGIPNHGKSEFVDQLAVNLMKNHKWRFAVFSPEHSTTNHIRRLTEKVAQRPFDEGPTPRMTEAELNDAMDALDGHFRFIEAEDRAPSIDWILEVVRGAVLRHGVQGVIIDPYNEISARRAEGMREDEHVRDLISQCKSMCRTHGLTIWLVAHPTKLQREQTKGKGYPVPTLYDIAGAAHWNNMADAGLVVYRDFNEGTTTVYSRKIREQGLYGQIGNRTFTYDVTTKTFVSKPDDGTSVNTRNDDLGDDDDTIPF